MGRRRWGPSPGSSPTVLARVLTYSGQRRGLVRVPLRQAGVAVCDGDPIAWLQRT